MCWNFNSEKCKFIVLKDHSSKDPFIEFSANDLKRLLKGDVIRNIRSHQGSRILKVLNDGVKIQREWSGYKRRRIRKDDLYVLGGNVR